LASKLLSKSKYLAGLRCPLLLWAYIHKPSSFPEVSQTTQHRFDEGNLVGRFAKRLFPRGIDIPVDNFMGNIRQTEKLLNIRKPLFEAGILCGRLYSRADILNPAENNTWDIYEVKSSTGTKETHFHDVAFQKRVYQQSGINIGRCFLIYIDTNYVKYGEVDPMDLFAIEDISSAVEDASIGMEDRIRNMLSIMDSQNSPDGIIGDYCLSPYTCDLKPVCWESLPENPIFELNGNQAKNFLLYEQGIRTINDIPSKISLTRTQAIQKECITTGKFHIDKGEICSFLEKLEYPRYYLEIKTINPAIPIYDGTRPYQHVPFQFSLQIAEQPNALPVHHSFLANSTSDPRLQFAEKLSQLLEPHGSVIVCDYQFKARVLQDLSLAFPRYQKWSEGIIARLIDLLSPFDDFHYYHPSQKDVVSFEKVLPAITSLDYETNSIASESLTGTNFMDLSKENIPVDEVASIRNNLLTRCNQETRAMVEIVKKLTELCIVE
jgi:hypothetical protein